MDPNSPYLNELLLHSRQFYEVGDVYNAAKLLRRIIKLAPDWWEPHAELAELYKKQGEWKAMMHFAKRAVSLNASNPAAWRNLGIAATALKKLRIAQTVWNKFGIASGETNPRAIVALRVPCNRQFEILWAHPLDPARALLTSIPHPASGRRFHDVLLFEFAPCGYTVSGRQRYPVFDSLGVFRHSPYQTFSCTTDTTDKKVLRILDKLCRQANIGFENWTNAARVMPFQSENAMPEFYGHEYLPPSLTGESLIALAATRKEDVEAVLRDWSVITLAGVSDLQCRL